MHEQKYETRCPATNKHVYLSQCMLCEHCDSRNFFKFWTINCVYPKKACK